MSRSWRILIHAEHDGKTYFELGKEILRKLLEKPVEHHATLDSTLRMQNKNYFGKLRVVQLLLDYLVAKADIARSIAKGALD